LLFGVVLVGIGLPQPSTAVNSVVPCTPTVEQPTGDALESGACPAGTLPTPAAEAGLLPDDVIVSIGPIASSSWDDLTEWIRANPGRSTQVVVERDGGQLSLPLMVADVERPVYDENGEPTGVAEQVGFLGVSPQFEYTPQPVTAVPAYMWDITYRSAAALVSLPVRVYELVDETLIGGGERSLDSPVSVVGASRLGGEVAAMDEPIKSKIAIFLGLAASLNLFLFLFNLLPVLPLDGGHVAGALYEGLRRSIARVRGKPDPGPVDTAKLLPVAYVVAAVLVAVGVVVIWADLIKPITLG
jgi:membrane-associated protease RseP (regulator of RpoE activity)